MRLVLDISVIVKAIRTFRGASAALIDQAVGGRVTLLSSTALWLEYEAVIKRPEHWVWPGFEAAEADGFLDVMAEVCLPVDIVSDGAGFSPIWTMKWWSKSP